MPEFCDPLLYMHITAISIYTHKNTRIVAISCLSTIIKTCVLWWEHGIYGHKTRNLTTWPLIFILWPLFFFFPRRRKRCSSYWASTHHMKAKTIRSPFHLLLAKKKSIYFFSEKKKMLRICCDPLHKQNKKLAVATNIFHGISESSVKVMYLYFYRFSRSVLSVNEIGQRLLNTAWNDSSAILLQCLHSNHSAG